MTLDTVLNKVLPAMERYIGQVNPSTLTEEEYLSWQRIQKIYIKNKFFILEVLKKKFDKDISNLTIDFCDLEGFVPKKNEKGEYLFATKENRKNYFLNTEKLLSANINSNDLMFFDKEDLKILPFHSNAEFQYQMNDIIKSETTNAKEQITKKK